MEDHQALEVASPLPTRPYFRDVGGCRSGRTRTPTGDLGWSVTLFSEADARVVQAETVRNLHQEVWGPGDWEEGTEHCLTRLDRLQGSVVLDLGCGVGRLAVPIADEHPNWRIIAVDTDPEMIATAPRRINIDYRAVVDGCLGLADESVDSAYSVIVFQHLPDEGVRRYLNEVRRVLRPRGWFQFQFAVGEEQADYHYQRSRGEIAVWLAQAGFQRVGTSGDVRFPTWCWVEAR